MRKGNIKNKTEDLVISQNNTFRKKTLAVSHFISDRGAILYVSYEKVQQLYCPFQSCEGVGTTSSRLQKGFAKRAQMGDAKNCYSQTVMDEASAERIGHLVCSQSFLGEGAVGYLFVSIMLQLHSEGFTSSWAVFTVSPLRRFARE